MIKFFKYSEFILVGNLLLNVVVVDIRVVVDVMFKDGVMLCGVVWRVVVGVGVGGCWCL